MFVELHANNIRIDEVSEEGPSEGEHRDLHQEEDHENSQFDQQYHQDSEILDVSAKSPSNQNSKKNIASEQQQDENDEIDSQYNYQELTDQLSRALTKIQGKERPKTQTFLDRVQYFEKKKQRQIQQLRQKKVEEQSKQNVKKSLTNTHSQKLLQTYQPIQQRYERILDQKRKKIQRQLQEKRRKEEAELQMQLKNGLKRTENTRSSSELVSNLNSWRQRKDGKIATKVQEGLQAQLAGLTFHPSINNNSKLMAKRNGKIPIYEQPVKPRKINYDDNCTFHPNLTKYKK